MHIGLVRQLHMTTEKLVSQPQSIECPSECYANWCITTARAIEQNGIWCHSRIWNLYRLAQAWQIPRICDMMRHRLLLAKRLCGASYEHTKLKQNIHWIVVNKFYELLTLSNDECESMRLNSHCLTCMCSHVRYNVPRDTVSISCI